MCALRLKLDSQQLIKGFTFLVQRMRNHVFLTIFLACYELYLIISAHNFSKIAIFKKLGPSYIQQELHVRNFATLSNHKNISCTIKLYVPFVTTLAQIANRKTKNL